MGQGKPEALSMARPPEEGKSSRMLETDLHSLQCPAYWKESKFAATPMNVSAYNQDQRQAVPAKALACSRVCRAISRKQVGIVSARRPGRD
jgi:hypothetical protein